jgi:hypothetical protein
MLATRSTGSSDSPSLEQVFQMLDSDGSGAADEASAPEVQTDVDRAVWPSMWVYLAAVTVMAVGAGLMGLAAPWRGCDDGVEIESSANMPLRLQRGP